MKLFWLVVALFVGCTSYAHDINKRPMPDSIYQTMIAPLLTDLSHILGITLPDGMPKIYLASGEEIRGAYCGDRHNCSNIAAITNRDTGEIIMNESFIPNNLFAVSILFHELVHWVQIKHRWFNDLPDCERWAQQEMQAYRAQAGWLRQHGHPGFEVPDLAQQCQHRH